jgi:hypothetical protein
MNNASVSNIRKIISIFALVLTLLTSLLTVESANASVTPATWYYESSNDGFTVNT